MRKENTMSMTKAAAAAAIFILSQAPALAAPPPAWCRNAKTLDEIAICDNEVLWRKDLLMWKRYHVVRVLSRNPADFNREQRRWIAVERRLCRADVTCLFKAYNERLEILQEMEGDLADSQ